jgi:hypothetical protein
MSDGARFFFHSRIWFLPLENMFFFVELFRHFFGLKNVEPKRWHKMKKFKRHIVAYEISDFFMLL